MTLGTGIHLSSDRGRPETTSVQEVNKLLLPLGAKVWTHDLSGLPESLVDFLQTTDPSPQQIEEAKPGFLFSRERLLEIIESSGRSPHVEGGGELVTVDETHGLTYPQLYVAKEDIDYSRFDRLHINVSSEGVAVNDITQLLCGSGLVLKFQTSEGEVLTVSLSCPAPLSGWLMAVDCATPFIGSFSHAVPGTKAVSQVIGPAKWQMKYVE